jgi:DHA1 family multidrug resistance protein-like MFS transporter
MGWMLRHPAILAGSVGNLMTSLAFSGLIINFLPLYVAQLGGGLALINAMFAGRALGSMLARFPTATLSRRLSSWLMIALALVLTLVALVGMSLTRSLNVLAALLLLEALAYGTFLTAGQAFVAENSTPSTRSTAIGVYSTAGGVGSTASPLVLGILADILGLPVLFPITASVTALGLVLIVWLYLRRRVAPVSAPYRL